MSNKFSGNNSQSLDSLLDAYLDFGVPQAGELRDGYLIAKRNNELLVDIGAKSEGIVPSSEVEQLSPEQQAALIIGSEIRVCVVDPEDENGNVVLSYLKVAEEQDWLQAEILQKSGEPCLCTIVAANRGGILAQLGSLRGFIPASQLATANQPRRANMAVEQLKKLVGKRLSLIVMEADRQQERLIMSEIAAEQRTKDEKRLGRFQEIKVGDLCDGEVINITDFGAFVDIGEIEGLVHTSELSWKHVRKASEVLKVGQKVRVSVIGIDEERKRITLSMKQVEINPWDEVTAIYQVGQLVEVTITQLTHYGAFARINDTYRLEGLIHISELSDDHIKAAADIVKKSQVLAARIIRIDSEQHQIGFSLKQVFSEKFMEIDLAVGAAAAVGAVSQ